MRNHPVAALGGAALAFVAVEALGLALVLLTWAALGPAWHHAAPLAVGVAVGVATGLTYGATEVVAASRGALRGALVGLALASLPSLCGAFALLRVEQPGHLEAIDALWRILADGDVWRPAAAVASLALALFAPLLATRTAERPIAAQVGAMGLGATTWLAGVVALDEWWPVGLPLAAWTYLLLLLVRVVATPPALALGDRLAARALDRLRGVDEAIRRRPLDDERPRAWSAIAAGALLGALWALSLRGAGEPAETTVARVRAAFGPDGRLALVDALQGPRRAPTGRFDPLLGVPGALQAHAPGLEVASWARLAELVGVLRGLVAAGHPEAIARAMAFPYSSSSRGPFPPGALLAAARASPEADRPTLQRVVGELLLARGERDEGLALLRRAAAQEDVRSLIALARRTYPTEAVFLLRRARRLATSASLRAQATALLEQRYDAAPEARSSVDPVEDRRVVDAAGGRPLDGAARLALWLPENDGWGVQGTLEVAREVRGGRVVGGLTSGCELAWGYFAFDADRLAAGIVDGSGLRVRGPEGDVVQVTLRPASDYAVVQGVVLEAAGRPLAGAHVTLRVARRYALRRGPREPGLEAVTDDAGRFLFRDIPGGATYEVGLLDDRGGLIESTLRRLAPGAQVTIDAPLTLAELLREG